MVAKIISFEGIDGSGKTTVINQVAKILNDNNKTVLCLQEPGTTSMGLKIRELIKSPVKRSHVTELLLFEASRADMVHAVILPALSKYDYIFLDRYIDSTIAYQGYGNQTDLSLIKVANKLAMQNILPYKKILIDVTLETAMKRRNKRNNNDIDMLDTNFDFAKRVYNGYQELVKSQELISVQNITLDETVQKVLSIIWQ